MSVMSVIGARSKILTHFRTRYRLCSSQPVRERMYELWALKVIRNDYTTILLQMRSSYMNYNNFNIKKSIGFCTNFTTNFRLFFTNLFQLIFPSFPDNRFFCRGCVL